MFAGVLDAAMEQKLIYKKGSWIVRWDGENLAQGRAAALDRLRLEPDLFGELEKMLKDPEAMRKALEASSKDETKKPMKVPKGDGVTRTPVELLEVPPEVEGEEVSVDDV
jgi:hypothetical protein